MDKLKYVKLENDDGSYSSSIPLTVDSDHVDVNGNTLTTELNNVVTKPELDILQNEISRLESGSPLVANSTAEMTDTNRIYVNLTDGHWYYYNNANWIDGGIYQATEVSDNSVSFNKLTTSLKEYKEIDADDLIYIKGYNVYQGQLISSENAVTSSAFLLPKGNMITINNEFEGRITCYDVRTKKYVSDSGAYGAITNFKANDDYIVRITFVNATTPSSTQRTDGNSTNIIFKGIVPNNKLVQNLIDNLTLTKVTSNTRVLTSKLFVGKGTKISFLDNELKYYYNNAWQTSNTLIHYDIRKAGSTTAIETTTNQASTITIDENCFIEIAVRAGGGISLTDEYAQALIKANLIIDYVPYFSDKLNAYVYTGDNYNFEIVDNKFKLNSSLLIFNGYQMKTYTWENLKTKFSAYLSTDYIAIPNYSVLYYDINTDDLYIVDYRTTNLKLGSQILPLMYTSYNQFIGGALYDRYISLTTIDNNINLNNRIDRIFNSVDYGNYSWSPKCFEFSQLLETGTNIETYLFFTDPHITGGSYGTTNVFDEIAMQKAISKLQKIYNSLPCNFIVCGGDWLNADVQNYAIWKLGYINGFMNSMFNNFYNVVGNHDTDYQGYLEPGSQSFTGLLDKDTLINLWYQKYNSTYYKFNGFKSMNYVLDSGLDGDFGGYWNKTMNMAKWHQVEWFAEQLIEDDAEHATVFVHAVWIDRENNIAPLTDNATKIINAYNNHTSITLTDSNYGYSQTFDFSNCTGHVDYVICGHVHKDYNAIVNGVLCIATDNFDNSGTITFDLVVNDYNNNKVKLIRVGTGDNREFDI